MRRDFLKLVPFGLGIPLLKACNKLARSNPTPQLIGSSTDHSQITTTTPLLESDIPKLMRVAFGSTGLEVSPLAFGTGTHGVGGHSDQSALGIDGLADLLLEAYDYGINFWDSADEYGTHPHLARALQNIPRDQVVILTKTMARNGERASLDIERFLKEINTEVIDIVLMHVITPRDWTTRYEDVMETLSRAKEQGKVRAIGISFHSLAALEVATQTQWDDVVMVRINHAGIEMDASTKIVEPLLAQMHTAGKAVLGMKVFGVGRLGNELYEALNYVFGLRSVDAITIGMRNRSELIKNVRMVGEIKS